MAWTAPKVDWASPDGVAYGDMNEIGENLLYLKEQHADLTTGIHGAVSAATASKIIIRDAAGRAKVAAPSAADDIALLSNVTAEATARSNADAALGVLITGLGTDKVDVAGDTMTGALVGRFPDTDYTTPMLRNIVLRTTVPTAGQIENGSLAFVYEA